MQAESQRWQAIGVVTEGDRIDIGGLNPWQFEWRQVRDEPVELPHPSYPRQRHRMSVYEIGGPRHRVRFAAGEVSANVWAFYVPADAN